MQRPLRGESGDRGGIVAKGVKRFRPDQRPKKERPNAPKRGLTAAEEAAAAAYEAKLEAPRVINVTTNPLDALTRGASAQRLAAEIATELPVVRRDLRRIVITYGGLVGLLAAIWLVATTTGFISA
ncbi:MAG: hypothetical protein ACKOD4_03570 [Candidatus Limnocylindrus sp.]|jgi:hypothetical protein